MRTKSREFGENAAMSSPIRTKSSSDLKSAASADRVAELLLSLCNEMSLVRNGQDLAGVIQSKLKKILQIKDYGILVINGNKKTICQFIHDSDSSFAKHTGFLDLMSGSNNFKDCFFETILQTKKSKLFCINEIMTCESMPHACRNWTVMGLEKAFGFPLKIKDDHIGILLIQQEIDSKIEDIDYDTISILSSQISIAFSNILANEQILRKDNERELLLSLNMEIAAARNNDELLKVFNQRLKKYFTFTHALIAIINDDKKTARNFLFDPESKSRSRYDNQHLASTTYPINDGCMDISLSSTGPVVFDLDQMDKNQELPFYLKVNFESGIKEVIVTRFSKGAEVFGFWMIFFDHKVSYEQSDLSLIGGLANQLSIAVSNIIANEEIYRREQEKSRILAFSNAIASVRDKFLLGKILKDQLKELFHIQDYVICAISEDKKTMRTILLDLDSKLAKHPDFLKILETETATNDGLFNIILDTDEPVIFEARDWLKLSSSSNYSNTSLNMGLKKMAGVPIRLGKENIAIMIFMQDEFIQVANQQNLFRCICSQIAITVSNIITNEKLTNRLAEINNYKRQLEEEKIYLKEEIETLQNYSDIVGNSPEMKKIFRLIEQVAHSDSTVLLLGETGTGKELIARAVHNASPRRSKLMVKVNCAALPASLIESELFGHERGSFTGATERRLGKFELANNGTLFLDEIGEMPMDLQVKLLRALQEREIERVGGNSIIKVNVRVIAATNRDLEHEMIEGRFRIDLFYRLNIFPIYLPPLRERKEDIPELASYFINRYAKKAGKVIDSISNKVLRELIDYPWPGNIRELEHLIERSVLLSTGDSIKSINLPASKQSRLSIPEHQETIIRTIDENERLHILSILKHCRGRIAGEGGAAQLLGVPPSTLNSKMKKLKIRKEHIG